MTNIPGSGDSSSFEFTFSSVVPSPLSFTPDLSTEKTQSDPSSSNGVSNKGSFSSLFTSAVEQESAAAEKNIWLPYSEYNVKREDGARGRQSPPSPSTIESNTDSLGGDYLPPSSLSSASEAHLAAQQAYRARSVSQPIQPSSFANRRGNLTLTIPQHFPIQAFSQVDTSPTRYKHLHDDYASPGGLSPAAGIIASQDYYWTEAMDESGGAGPMDTSGGEMTASSLTGTMLFGGTEARDMNQNQGGMPMDAYLPDGTIAGPHVRYGYRMPASQPSSPVRSGFPPGMAPFPGTGGGSQPMQQAYGRPRGVTVSGEYHYPNQVYGDPRMAFQGAMGGGAPLLSSPALMDQSGALSYPFTPLESPGGMQQGISGHSSQSSLSASSSVHVSPFIQQHMQMTAIAASPTQIQPSRQPQQMVDMVHAAAAQGIAMQYQMAEAPQIEPPQFGLGMGDIAMDANPSHVSGASGPASVAGSVHEDMLEEAARMSQAGSRRSSVSVPGFHPTVAASGSGFPSPMTSITTAAPQMVTMPDLSSQINDKLSLIESIVHDANAARAELLRGQGGAADDRLSDIGNRLMGSAAFASPGSITPSGLGGTITPGGMTGIALAPLLDAAVSANSTPPSPAALQREGSTATVLAPAFELLRSSSTASKRAAPESSPLAAAATVPLPPNKHIRLGDATEVQDIMERPESTPIISSSIPPPMVHSHSYPNGHQLPSQQAAMSAGAPPPLPLTPSLATSTFTPSLNIPAHAPHVPSPLSNLHMSSHPPSPVLYFQNPPMVDGSNMVAWDGSSYHPDQALYYPDTFVTQPEEEMTFNTVIQQPLTTHRQGAIVDGRLIAGRPTLTTRKSGSDLKALSASAIPTMSAIGTVNPAEYSGGVSTGPSGDAGGGDDDGDSDSGGDDGGSPRPSGRRRRSSDAGGGGGGPSSKAAKGKLVQPTSLVSDEIKEQLDRIMLEFLNRVCSNLEITDSKGELLHQVLMAKKMARLDESTDFRPFKFRIQAFTNSFHEELLSRGVMDETLSGKKVKSYLWTNNLISRFNDDGKKSKSKGNHIWNVDAKKLPDGSWVFREFRRKIAGSPPQKALVGQPWSWSPRVWDPQASTNGLVVDFYSPEGGLPKWLSWSGNQLSGTPEEGDVGGNVMVIAAFMDSDNKRHVLSTSFAIDLQSRGDSGFSSRTHDSRTSHEESDDMAQVSYGETHASGLMAMTPSPMNEMHKPFNAFATSTTMSGDQDMEGTSLHPGYAYSSLPMGSASMPVLQQSAFEISQTAGSLGEGFYGNGQ